MGHCHANVLEEIQDDFEDQNNSLEEKVRDAFKFYSWYYLD